MLSIAVPNGFGKGRLIVTGNVNRQLKRSKNVNLKGAVNCQRKTVSNVGRIGAVLQYNVLVSGREKTGTKFSFD